jgi:hypothetical protein
MVDASIITNTIPGGAYTGGAYSPSGVLYDETIVAETTDRLWMDVSAHCPTLKYWGTGAGVGVGATVGVGAGPPENGPDDETQE